MMKIFVAVALSLFLSGCASQLPRASDKTQARHVLENNYTIGVRNRSTVGEPVVKVKDYYVQRTESLAVRPTSDITLSRALTPTLTFSANQVYPISHEITVDGSRMFVVPHLRRPELAAVVRPDGSVYPRAAGIIMGSPALAWADFNISPPDGKMLQEVEERIVKTKGYVNYELIYNGTSGGAIYLTYREFTPEDIARTAFFQNLTYDARIGTIRFRQLRIQVHAVSNEGIDFTVVGDR